MEERDNAAQSNDFSAPAFQVARQFADADVIVIAAPYNNLKGVTEMNSYITGATIKSLREKKGITQA